MKLFHNRFFRKIGQFYSGKRKKLKIVLTIVILTILVMGSWLGVGIFRSLSKIFTSNEGSGSAALSFLDNVTADQLSGEGDGRINILLLGYGGENHPGAYLTDTMIILSIDPVNKDMAMLSIPRDLWVDVPGYGYSKINAAYYWGTMMESSGQQVDGKSMTGPALAKKTVSEIVDLPIHYYISMDFDGFIKLINKLGGLDIDVTNSIYDTTYPSEDYGYETFSLSAGQHHMDGALALKYARSRHSTSDFDRAARQQKVISAIKTKALKLSILANPQKVVSLASILGDHIRTDLKSWEIERLTTIVRDIDTSKTVSEVLDNSVSGPLKSATMSGQSVLITKTGDYSVIQEIAHSIFSDPYITKENAQVRVLNGTTSTGLASRVAAKLKNYGYNVVSIGTASATQERTEIIDFTNNRKPFTLKFLAARLSAKISYATPKSSSSPDMMVIIGTDYQE